MKHLMRVLNHRGDEETQWELDDPKAVDAARQKFDEMTAKGMAAFECLEDGQTKEKVKSFNPEAAEIVFVSPMVGG